MATHKKYAVTSDGFHGATITAHTSEALSQIISKQYSDWDIRDSLDGVYLNESYTRCAAGKSGTETWIEYHDKKDIIKSRTLKHGERAPEGMEHAFFHAGGQRK